jgi:creatinine amidohydrolase
MGFLKSDKSEFLWFEDSAIGKMKKEVFEMTPEEVDAGLAEYGVPSAPEWGKPGSYIQTTPRYQAIENRRKNDIVLIPVGCSENHGMHSPSAEDTLFATSICEAVRRYSVKSGKPVNVALPPWNYGCHPYHHMGMPGTIMIREEIAKEQLIDVMLGLWNDGYRKQIIVNNHGQLWVLEATIQQFCKRYQLPGIYRCMDWHRAVRELFATTEQGGEYDTPFTHADEAETAMGLLLFPEMMEFSKAVNTTQTSYLPGGHMDVSIDAYRRPSKWSECQGHIPMELFGCPEGVVGKARAATAEKAKKPMLAICRYLTLLIEEILEAYPAGKVPPVEGMTLRSDKEMEPYLREPQSEGWKSVYGVPKLGYTE